MASLSKPTGLDLSIDQMYDWYRVNFPDDPAIVYLDENDIKRTITWHILWKAIMKGSEIINHELPELQDGNSEDKPMVVAILANIDNPTYAAFLYAHFRLTHLSVGRSILPFLISIRNSQLGVADLIKNTQTEAIWVSEGPMRNLAEEALKTNSELKARILTVPSFNDLYHPQQEASIPAEYDSRPVSPDTPLIILHSSGSTAFPKMRTLRHISGKEWAVDNERREVSMQGETIAVSPPIYHGMGLISTLWLAGSRTIVAYNSPHKSPGPISSDEFLKLTTVTEAKYMITIPNFLEDWCENKDAVKYLQSMKGIIWGGGPVNGDSGERLFDQGVPLYLMYGTTETGIIHKAISTPIKEGYEYFSFGPHVSIHLAPMGEPDVFQVIVMENDVHHLNVYNTDLNGVPAWNTNDIVVRHPSNPDIYRFRGRSDDQIMLSTGQKTNPGPLERIIKRNPHVRDVVYFGRGRASNGILVQPQSFEKAENLGVAGFRNLIWQSVEEANAYAPVHSRIFKEMILIVKQSKPFVYTAKETLSKGVVLDAYRDEIDDLYNESANSVRAEVPIPLGTHPDGGWTEDESIKFAHQVVHLIMKDRSNNMTNEDDIFVFGCDSLLATYIRNTLLNGLRQVAPPSHVERLSINFVYQSPTINQLSKVLTETSRFELSSLNNEPESQEAREQRLKTIITRYTQNWPIHKPEKEMGEDEIVLLTGTTGALGSQMLVQLISLPTIKKIYAVNRPTGQSLYERHVSTFTDRGHDIKLLQLEKVILVEGEVSVPGFGIDPQLYEEMRVSTTTIIHNAWRVNFKISLASYEPAIRSVRLLVDFALSSPFITPPKLLFTSSIGNIKPWVALRPIPEASFLNIDQLSSMGYTESKWICERILTIAAEKTALEPLVVRVGQMAGGDAGDWNATEWFPNLVGASQRINSLPSCSGTAAYLLLPTAASAMLELRHASIRFAHLVDPKPAQFNDLIKIISEKLKLPIIPYLDWLQRLITFCQSNNDIMAEHLLDVYKASAQPETFELASGTYEAMGWAVFDTTNTVQAAPSLRDTPTLGRQEVERWLIYWRRKQLLS